MINLALAGALTSIVTEIASGERYGLLAGYKQFLNSHIGLRYYANVSFNNFGKQGDTIRLTNYGVKWRFIR